ncbi:MAG: ribosome maturation factor RimM [Candidatus Zixiibacteriota bacterium]
MNNKPDYIVVGRFGRPKGVSGEIYVIPISDNPERFQKSGSFWMESEAGWKKVELVLIQFASGKPVVKIEGIDSPEQAKSLTNGYLYIKGTDLGELPDGAYYHFDLIGCRVVDTGGTKLGELVAVEEFPANDVWVILDGNGKRKSFPAVRQFIKNVDIENKLIEINPPEGIFDSPDED